MRVKGARDSAVFREVFAQARPGNITPQVSTAGVEDEAQLLPGRADRDIAEVEGFLGEVNQ